MAILRNNRPKRPLLSTIRIDTITHDREVKRREPLKGSPLIVNGSLMFDEGRCVAIIVPLSRKHKQPRTLTVRCSVEFARVLY